MSAIRGLLAALLFFALLGVAAPAPAAPGDRAEAEALFREARTLMKEGERKKACALFAKSLAIYPSVGAQLNLGRCHEMVGKTASAWLAYKQAETMATKADNPERQEVARKLVMRVEPRLSKLTILALAWLDVPGASFQLDGVELTRDKIGAPVPLDPGRHEVKASAPGYRTWSQVVFIGVDADRKSVVPVLEKTPPKPPPGSEADDASQDQGAGSVAEPVGWALTAVGLTAVMAGIVFGTVADGKVSDAESDPALCPQKLCSPAGEAALEDAATYADVSTVTITIGAIAAAAGVVLLVTTYASSDDDTSDDTTSATRMVPFVGPSSGGVGLVGTF